MHFVLLGEVQPKERPRLSPNGTYTPAKTRQSTSDLQIQMRPQMCGHEPISTPIRVTMRLYVSASRMRADIDNLAKTVLDAGNKIIWSDDRLIQELHVYKLKSKDNFRTEVDVEEA